MILTKVLKPFSSRKSTDRPSIGEFSKKEYLGSDAKKLDSKRNFATFQSVQVHRCKNRKSVIIGHLNVNLLRNKFVAVDELIKKIDACLISETKVDELFPKEQFKINGYKIFWKDRNRLGGGLMFYVNEKIPGSIFRIHSYWHWIKSVIVHC